MTRKIDSAASKHSLSPPPNRVSNPCSAAGVLPDIVTSRTSTPCSEPTLESSREVSGYTVLRSMTSEPGRALAKTPSGPLYMFRTASSLGRQDNTTLQLEESSETLCATVAPYLVSTSALLGSRS